LLGGAVNRPLGRVEDLARELVRSLSPEIAARAVLLEKAPSDFVTANRTTVSEGDQVIPLAGIWRDRRFPDDTEQAKLQKLSDAIDEAAAFTAEDHRTVEYTTAPKGIPGRALDTSQREPPNRGSRTTTGSRVHGCSSSGTTPSVARTMRTRSGATPRQTSASMLWRNTEPCTTDTAHPRTLRA
jgi:hypothetical protein